MGTDGEEKQEANAEHLFSMGISKAMAYPIRAACLALCTLFSDGQMFCSRGTWVCLLKYLFLIRISESFISEEFFLLILSLIKFSSLIFYIMLTEKI